MLAERSSPRLRVGGPLAVALLLHGLALAGAAVVGFRVTARVEEVQDTLTLALRPPVEPLPEPAPLSELEFLASDDIPEIEATAEPMPFDLQTYDLAELPPPSVVPSAPLPFVPPEELAPGAAALGLLSPRIAVASAGGGGSSAPAAPPGASSTGTETPGAMGLGAAGNRAGAAGAVLAAASRPAVVRQPTPITTPPPSYPRLSNRAGEEGTVVCRLHISELGKVTEVEVVESSGFERLDKAARETLLGWVYEPCRVDGRGVASTLMQPVTFRLDG